MIYRYKNRLEQIDQLIRQKRTGNAMQFAEKIGVSRRQIYNFLDDLKNLGMEIEYDRNSGTYYYKKLYKLRFTFDIEELDEQEMFKCQGGQNLCRKALKGIYIDRYSEGY